MSALKRRRVSDKPGRRPTAKLTGGAVRLPRRSKGRRPQFYDDPAIDQLFAIVTALTAEVSVLFDRLDSLERLLVRGGALSPTALESYEPDPRAVQQRAQRRDELLQRVFAVFEAYPQKSAAGR